MKKLLFLFAVLLLPVVASAQKNPGTLTLYPRIGVNWSKFAGDKVYNLDNANGEDGYAKAKFTAGFTVGAELQYQFNNVFAGSIGALYSRQGSNYNYPSELDDEKITTDNILVPVMLVATTNIGLSFKVGLQPEFKLNDSFINDALKTFSLAVPVGVSYEWNNIALDVRYNIGVTKLYNSDFYPSARESTILVTLGYGFDL